jgi:hypothetical protein
MKAATCCIWTELEETTKHWVADVLVALDRRTLGFREEINGKIEQTQSDLHEEFHHRTQGTQAETQATNTLVESKRHGLKAEMGKVTNNYLQEPETTHHKFKMQQEEVEARGACELLNPWPSARPVIEQ